MWVVGPGCPWQEGPLLPPTGCHASCWSEFKCRDSRAGEWLGIGVGTSLVASGRPGPRGPLVEAQGTQGRPLAARLGTHLSGLPGCWGGFVACCLVLPTRLRGGRLFFALEFSHPEVGSLGVLCWDLLPGGGVCLRCGGAEAAGRLARVWWTQPGCRTVGAFYGPCLGAGGSQLPGPLRHAFLQGWGGKTEDR